MIVDWSSALSLLNIYNEPTLPYTIQYTTYNLLFPIPHTSAWGLFDLSLMLAAFPTARSSPSTNSACDAFIVSTASRSMRSSSSALVGMS